MKKLLILFFAFSAVFIFSSVERVSAHSPPESGFMFQDLSSKSKAAAAVVSIETPYILHGYAVQPGNVLTREFTLENNPTFRTAPDLRGNLKTVRQEPEYCRKALYDLPPEGFPGFGFENNARAKI